METVRVLEPRVNIKQDVEKNHVVLYGGMRINEQIQPADSYNSSQALWTVNPPSTRTITDRYFKVRSYLRITTDQPHQLGTNDALRQLPLNSIVDVTTVQINGESISDNSGDKLHAMLCYGNDRTERNRSLSMAPSMPDSYQEYADWGVYGSAKNPLSAFGENGAEDPRGGFPVNVVSPTVFEVVVTEPLMISPFFNGCGMQEEGFVNVNQFNISLRYKSDLARVLSHSTLGNAITSVQVEFYQQPEMLCTFITPDMTQPIPDMQVLPYHKSQDYIKSVPSLAAGATTRVTSDSIKLSQIPRRLYLFVRHSRSSSTFNTSDSFLSVEGLSILWNNNSGLFSGATKEDLFEISRRNGLNISYQSWAKYRGGVMCIEFGKDIGLLDDEAPGVQGQYTIQIQMDVKNQSSSAFEGEFYQVFLMEGTFSIAENMGRASLGNLTKGLVLDSKEHPTPEVDYAHYEHLQGGSFFSSLKNIVNKVAHGVGSVADVASKVVSAVPGLSEIAPVISTVGDVAHGVEALSGKGLAGGRLAGGRLAGGRLAGGQVRRRKH